MADPDVILPPDEVVMSWQRVRNALARVITAAAPLARVHPSWELHFDLAKSVTQITVDDVTNPDDGKVHSWMIGVERAEHVKNAAGANPTIGGAGFEWLLTLAVWGFFDYFIGTADVNSHAACEAEVRRVSATVFLNSSGLAMEDPRGLKEVKDLDFTSIDVHSFSEGQECHVAQGTLQVRISEDF